MVDASLILGVAVEVVAEETYLDGIVVTADGIVVTTGFTDDGCGETAVTTGLGATTCTGMHGASPGGKRLTWFVSFVNEARGDHTGLG
jgi:hypothetical protein